MEFNINTNKNIDKKNIQFNVVTSKKNKFENDIFFIENLGIAINRKGRPVWFMQKDERIELDEKSYRSMQLTDDGNIIFLTLNNAYETDLQGNILWEAPKPGILNAGGTESYHHHIAKTSQGSYMAISYAWVKQPHLLNASTEVNVRYNTLLEFDKMGNLLWSWNEKDHSDQTIIFENSTGDETEWAGTHMNGFVFSKKDNSLFLSFRNSSQIQKIDYLTGKVLYTWSGKPAKFNNPPFSFYNQHGPSITSDGNLLVYNNNIKTGDNKKPVYPTIQLIQNPNDNKMGNMLWEYECKWDAKKEGIQTKEGFALELGNKNILVTIGGTERIFEVNKNKEIVWDCTFKKIDKDSVNYIPFSNYRCYSTASLHPILFGANGSNFGGENKLMIYNLGTTDEYIITIIDKNNLSQIYSFTQKILGQSEQNILLKKIVKKLPQGFIVEIKSKTNEQKMKQIYF
jgi:hypothetical protein